MTNGGTDFPLRTTLLLSGLAAVNLLGSFLIQWVVVLTLGPGQETDALFAALTAPQVVLAIAAGSLMHVLVPLLSTERGDGLRQQVWTLIALIAALGSAAAIVLFLSAPIWVAWLVPGFTPETRSLTVALTRIQMPGLVLTAVISVLWAAHRARRRFVWPEFAALIGVIATLAALIWGLPRYGIVLAAWAMVARAGIQVVLLMPGVGRFSRPHWGTPMMIAAWSRIKPLLIGTSYYKMEPAVDRYLASMAGSGGVSLLYIAQQIYATASQVLNAAVTVPMVPALAAHAHAGEWTAFRRLYRHRLAVMVGIAASLYIAVLLFGKPVLQLIITDRRLTREEMDQLWWILVALVGLLVAGAGGQIVASTFYATGDTRTLMWIGFVVFTLGIVFKVVGFAEAGLVGLAIGTSLYYVVSAGVQYAVLETRYRDAACSPT